MEPVVLGTRHVEREVIVPFVGAADQDIPAFGGPEATWLELGGEVRFFLGGCALGGRDSERRDTGFAAGVRRQAEERVLEFADEIVVEGGRCGVFQRRRGSLDEILEGLDRFFESAKSRRNLDQATFVLGRAFEVAGGVHLGLQGRIESDFELATGLGGIGQRNLGGAGGNLVKVGEDCLAISPKFASPFCF
jgi:hypothetical protein